MFTILIVDDEWIIREGLKRTVPWKDWNMEVIGVATNGHEALDILATSPVDILLTDIRMPGINGLELIERCQKLYPKLKTVLLTGHDEFEYAQKAIKLGADDFLLKPTNIEELKETIHSITEELRIEEQESYEHISLLIKDVIEHHTFDNLAKIQSFNTIKPGYGIMIIRHPDSKKRLDLTLDHALLIEDKGGQLVYFFYSICNEEHWNQCIHDVKNSIKHEIVPSTLHVSLLTQTIEEIINIYKQASAATDVYHECENVTVYKYHDDKYTLGFEEVIQYIHQHFQQPISQSELANRLHMSNSYFSKLFKQHTGMNFVEYLTNKRIEAAKELLHSTTLKTYEIAYEVGYSEPRYFSQLFKKVTGQSPGQYRDSKR